VLKNRRIRDLTIGFIAYFIVSWTLDLFDLNTGIVRFIVFLIIVFIGYFIIPLFKEK